LSIRWPPWRLSPSSWPLCCARCVETVIRGSGGG
jgi:hypothetical protein